jgi:putative phage-type endonuclease
METTERKPKAVRINGSRIGSILGLNKYKKPEEVLREMVREHFGIKREFQGNDATRWGEEHEQEAIEQYESISQKKIHSAQMFAVHQEYDWLSVMPDGLVDMDGMVEIKCPFSAYYNHIHQKPEYEAQIRLQFECCNRQWCDFVVWRETTIHISRVERKPEWFKETLPKLEKFYGEYKAIISDEQKAAPFLVEHEN